jgi:two-component system, OmpR family, sensor histidine kinase KdpD
MDDRVAPSSPRVNDHGAAHLVTYLGTAPGVGKTFRMLRDARARAEAGDDVVVGWVERHGRAATREQAQQLELIPGRVVAHRGAPFDDLDVSAVIDRHPEIVLVDELAHTGVDGRARYQDVQNLLNAGIDVMTTVNVANLLSVRDLASRITGAGALEGVPDDVVRAGDVVLVDLAPDALRRRVADGLVYSADAVGGALANYFRAANLQLLDKLARSWLDGSVDETFAFLDREAPGREKVIAGVSSSIRGQAVIERAAVLAGEDDAELEVVHVEFEDGLGRQRERLDQYREMAEGVGARYREVYGVNAADTLGDLARSEHARRVVVGARRSRLTNLLRGSVASRIRRRAPGIQVDEVAA